MTAEEEIKQKIIDLVNAQALADSPDDVKEKTSELAKEIIELRSKLVYDKLKNNNV